MSSGSVNQTWIEHTQRELADLRFYIMRTTAWARPGLADHFNELERLVGEAVEDGRAHLAAHISSQLNLLENHP